MTLQQKRNSLNKQLQKINVVHLQDWLNEASKIPELTQALQGIYCGKEGRIHEPLDDHLWIDMGWYTVTYPKVEYAYVS